MMQRQRSSCGIVSRFMNKAVDWMATTSASRAISSASAALRHWRSSQVAPTAASISASNPMGEKRASS